MSINRGSTNQKSLVQQNHELLFWLWTNPFKVFAELPHPSNGLRTTVPAIGFAAYLPTSQGCCED